MTTTAFNIDLHLHTRRYSSCAELLNPLELQRAQDVRPLHGVVITEHDYMWSGEETRALQQELPGFRIYRGAEVSCVQGHFVVIGAEVLPVTNNDLDVITLLDTVLPQGAAVIWAHPFVGKLADKVAHNIAACRNVSAVEVMSSVTRELREQRSRELAAANGWHMVAGSDGHYIELIGSCYTRFTHMPVDEKELATLIKNGDGVAVRDVSSSG